MSRPPVFQDLGFEAGELIAHRANLCLKSPAEVPMAQPSEWIGGRFPAPVIITGGDVPHRPELSLWMEVEGPIVGMALDAPGEHFAPTVSLLRKSLEKPMAGPPRRPRRVRVAEPELAALLRAEFGPELDVVVGDTPEFDEVLADMQEHFGGKGEKPPGYLEAGDLTSQQMASFFRAAARLYRAAPWKHIPGDQDLLTVDIEALGVRGSVVSVIGRMGENFGFIVFQSRADFERFLSEADEGEARQGIPDLPQYLALNFAGGRDVPESIRKEVAAQHWEVASRYAFPVVFAVHGTAPYDPSPKDMARLEAISNAAADLVTAEPNLGDAWAKWTGLSRAFRVEAAGVKVEVQVNVSARPVSESVAGVFDVRAQKLDEDGEIDEDWAAEFEDELLKRFSKSPEAKELPDGDWMSLILQYGVGYLNQPLARIGAAELREILFEIFPRKVSCEPQAATTVINEVRAFWSWTKREFQLETADECLAMLYPGVEKKLERELANTDKFGMAKSVLMGGIAAGYDVTTREGLDQLMADANAGKVPLPPTLAFPGGATSNRKADQDRKKRRKMRKAAQRRNR